MNNLAIGILCYSNNYLDRITSWVRRLNPYVPAVIYHDNTKFSNEDYYKLDNRIKVIEGIFNKGTFLSRLYLMKYLSENFKSFIMIDDDDFGVSNLFDICNKDIPMNDLSAVFYYGGILGTQESVDIAINKGEYIETAPAEPCVFMAEALFNSKYMKEFVNLVLDNLDKVNEIFGTTRIIAGEDELLNYTYYWFVKTKYGTNKTKLYKEIIGYSDTTMYGDSKYSSDDYRYSKDSKSRDKLWDKFSNNMELFKDFVIKKVSENL